MKLDWTVLAQQAGEALDFDFEEFLPGVSEPAASANETAVRAVGPVAFSGRLCRTGRGAHLELTGRVAADVEGFCTRCLAPVRMRIESPVCVTFDRGAVAADGSDAEKPDRADYPISGSELDLETVARDALLLAVPMQFLCRSDCAGRCAHCGRSLNAGHCGCQTDHSGAASPFDILKTLL